MRSADPELARKLGFADGLKSVVALPDHKAMPIVVSCLTDFQSAEPVWRALEAASSGSVYQRYDWCKVWFGTANTETTARPLIIVLSREERPICVLPLYTRVVGPGIRQARFMGEKHANVRVPLCTTSSLDRLALLQAASDGGVVDLIAETLRTEGHADHLALESLPDLLDGDINILARGPRVKNAVLLFSGTLQADFEALKMERRSIKSQSKTRKNLRKIRKIGELEFARLDDRDAVDRALTAFFEQKNERLEDARIDSAFAVESNRTFIRRLAHQSLASASRTLDLYALLLNGQPIAIAGGGVHGDRFSMGINSMTNDPHISACSPGRLSVDMAVEAFCREGLQAFDLGLGENEYKRMWCSPVELYDVTRALTPKGRVFDAVVSLRRAAITTLRRSPPLVKAAKQIRYHLNRVLARHGQSDT